MKSVERYSKGRTCETCGRRVTDRGQDSKIGKYWCPAEECRRARDRYRQMVHRYGGPVAVRVSIEVHGHEPWIERQEEARREYRERLEAAQRRHGLVPGGA